MSKFCVVIKLNINPERLFEWDDLIQNVVTKTHREESGCLKIDVLNDSVNHPLVFWLYEVYKDKAAYEHHKSTKYYKDIIRFLQGGGITSPPEINEGL